MDDATLLSSLEESGLTHLEARIYLVLVENGALPAGELAKKAGTHRRLAYDATARLMAKGLVGSVERNKRTVFEAVRPNRILDILDERKQRLSGTVERLQQLWGSGRNRQQVLIFEGFPGLKSVLEDQLATGKEILIVSPVGPGHEAMKFYFHWYDVRRAKNKVPVKIIFPDDKKERLKDVPLAQGRFLPPKAMGPAAFNVYGDNVALILWTEKPVAVLIRNAEMAASYRGWFEILWKAASPGTRRR